MTQNQCCGCIRGLPVTPEGFHRTDTELFCCTAHRYRLELEPKSSDTWHKPGARKAESVPFVVGGES